MWRPWLVVLAACGGRPAPLPPIAGGEDCKGLCSCELEKEAAGWHAAPRELEAALHDAAPLIAAQCQAEVDDAYADPRALTRVIDQCLARHPSGHLMIRWHVTLPGSCYVEVTSREVDQRRFITVKYPHWHGDYHATVYELGSGGPVRYCPSWVPFMTERCRTDDPDFVSTKPEDIQCPAMEGEWAKLSKPVQDYLCAGGAEP